MRRTALQVLQQVEFRGVLSLLRPTFYSYPAGTMHQHVVIVMCLVVPCSEHPGTTLALNLQRVFMDEWSDTLILQELKLWLTKFFDHELNESCWVNNHQVWKAH